MLKKIFREKKRTRRATLPPQYKHITNLTDEIERQIYLYKRSVWLELGRVNRNCCDVSIIGEFGYNGLNVFFGNLCDM